MLSLCAARYVKVITGMPISDPTGGFKCFRRKALQSIDLDRVRSNGYSFQIEMTHKIWMSGMPVAEVPIIFTDRFQGSSKMSSKIVREALTMVWRLWIQNGFGVPRAKRKRPLAPEGKTSWLSREVGKSGISAAPGQSSSARKGLPLKASNYWPIRRSWYHLDQGSSFSFFTSLEANSACILTIVRGAEDLNWGGSLKPSGQCARLADRD